MIELKVGPFKPEYAGKMSFYLSAVDDLLRQSGDHSSIGLILCKERNKLVVEYALRDSKKPIGVAVYRLTERLPERLKGKLPTIRELETELAEEGRADARHFPGPAAGAAKNKEEGTHKKRKQTGVLARRGIF